MDDATKKMLVTIVGPILRKGLITAGSALTTHGILASNQTETFVSVGMAVAGLAWSFWNDYGRAIVLSQLEVLKAKSLAQAAKLQAHDIAPPTVEQIADHGPKELTAATVTKVAATLCLLLAFGLMASPAFAQRRGDSPAPVAAPAARAQLPFDPLHLNTPAVGAGSPLGNLLGALDAKLLPDLQYALKLATASGSKVTAPCYSAWIDIIQTRQKAVDDGANPPSPLPMPDPHLVTDFEKLVELRNSLQPDSPFMISCSPVASMVKKDIIGFIGTVISGGAGLATLVPGL